MMYHFQIISVSHAEVPVKWVGYKRKLTTYLSAYLARPSQKYVTAGGTDTTSGLAVTKDGVCQLFLDSCTDESDARVWLHTRHSAGVKKLILSPDTDVYQHPLFS